MARSHKDSAAADAGRGANQPTKPVRKNASGKVDRAVKGKDDWGYQPAKGGMAVEAKMGMFIIMILVGAFGFLVYRKVDMHQMQLSMDGQTSPNADATKSGSDLPASGQSEQYQALATSEYAADYTPAAPVGVELPANELPEFGLEPEITAEPAMPSRSAAAISTFENTPEPDTAEFLIADASDSLESFDSSSTAMAPDADDATLSEFALTEPGLDAEFPSTQNTEIPAVSADPFAVASSEHQPLTDEQFVEVPTEDDSFPELPTTGPSPDDTVTLAANDPAPAQNSLTDDIGWQSQDDESPIDEAGSFDFDAEVPEPAFASAAEDDSAEFGFPEMTESDTDTELSNTDNTIPPADLVTLESPADFPVEPTREDNLPDFEFAGSNERDYSLAETDTAPDMLVAMRDDGTTSDFQSGLNGDFPEDEDNSADEVPSFSFDAEPTLAPAAEPELPLLGEPLDLAQDQPDTTQPEMSDELPDIEPAPAFDEPLLASPAPQLTPTTPQPTQLPATAQTAPAQREFSVQGFEYENKVMQASAEEDPVDVVEVKPGDNYWKISRRAYGTTRYFSALALYNRHRIRDPKKLRIGMKVLVPTADVLEDRYPQLFRDRTTRERLPAGYFVQPDGTAAYRIDERDTLSEIAQKHLGRSSRWIQIYRLNRGVLPNPNRLKPGTVIILPDDATDVHVVP